LSRGARNIDENLVNRVFRAAHSIKGRRRLLRPGQYPRTGAQDGERARPDPLPADGSHPETVSILLMAFDKLRELIADHRQSNQVEIEEFMSAADRAHLRQPALGRERIRSPSGSKCRFPIPASIFKSRLSI
jgi:two-component system, chemotaxis family, sensor kinase CheA